MCFVVLGGHNQLTAVNMQKNLIVSDFIVTHLEAELGENIVD